MEGGQQVIQVKCAPKEWPLFSAPGLSSMRVVGYKEKGGVLVSLVLHTYVVGFFPWNKCADPVGQYPIGHCQVLPSAYINYALLMPDRYRAYLYYFLPWK